MFDELVRAKQTASDILNVYPQWEVRSTTDSDDLATLARAFITLHEGKTEMRSRIEDAIVRVIEQARKELITNELADAIRILEHELQTDRAAREILASGGVRG